MTKLFATLVTLKAVLIAASVALARGDAHPVVVISALLTLVQFSAKPFRQVVVPLHDRDRQILD